jgi:hypothetical protein
MYQVCEHCVGLAAEFRMEVFPRVTQHGTVEENAAPLRLVCGLWYPGSWNCKKFLMQTARCGCGRREAQEDAAEWGAYYVPLDGPVL